MTNYIYEVHEDQFGVYDLYESANRYCSRYSGTIVYDRESGKFRHYYNMNGTKGSVKKFESFSAAIDSVDKRRARRIAKWG